MSETTKRIWEIINSLDTLDIDDYELRGDNGDYTPNDREKTLMVDFNEWCMNEIVEAIATHLHQEVIRGELEVRERLIKDLSDILDCKSLRRCITTEILNQQARCGQIYIDLERQKELC